MPVTGYFRWPTSHPFLMWVDVWANRTSHIRRDGTPRQSMELSRSCIQKLSPFGPSPPQLTGPPPSLATTFSNRGGLREARLRWPRRHADQDRLKRYENGLGIYRYEDEGISPRSDSHSSTCSTCSDCSEDELWEDEFGVGDESGEEMDEGTILQIGEEIMQREADSEEEIRFALALR
ncbi:hypothetical protein JAAARDRAFT_208407 [Jaapia argillacea MUCL 33604]|uniref:Uncharacterized protein n=1 Tax=Jaapia argillacea MUCL 33604 TaxID=933084 RepID=A0A067PP48_9AGAM|nr:hypothetical protein JAAARDRAFT_208407 [Jaapia argillacea MUCL 33604]